MPRAKTPALSAFPEADRQRIIGYVIRRLRGYKSPGDIDAASRRRIARSYGISERDVIQIIKEHWSN